MNGYVYRLYPKKLFEQFNPFNIPEIKRIPIENTLLQILYLGYNDIFTFLNSFIEPPEAKDVRETMNMLITLKAVESSIVSCDEYIHRVVRSIQVDSSGLPFGSDSIAAEAFQDADICYHLPMFGSCIMQSSHSYTLDANHNLLSVYSFSFPCPDWQTGWSKNTKDEI